MSAYTEKELEYLGSQRLGRLATVDAGGRPHVTPVTFRYNPQQDTIDIGGYNFAKSKKYRDILATGHVALVVDDVKPPWQPRLLEIRGRAEVLSTGGLDLGKGFDAAMVRIVANRIVSSGIDTDQPRAHGRSVATETHGLPTRAGDRR